MKRLLLIVSVVATLGLLIASFTTPIFAHSPDDGGASPANGESWEEMHEACTGGDWEAMAEASEEVHGEDFSYMPCHNENNYTPTGGWGMMGGGMMGDM